MQYRVSQRNFYHFLAAYFSKHSKCYHTLCFGTMSKFTMKFIWLKSSNPHKIYDDLNTDLILQSVSIKMVQSKVVWFGNQLAYEVKLFWFHIWVQRTANPEICTTFCKVKMQDCLRPIAFCDFYTPLLYPISKTWIEYYMNMKLSLKLKFSLKIWNISL